MGNWIVKDNGVLILEGTSFIIVRSLTRKGMIFSIWDESDLVGEEFFLEDAKIVAEEHAEMLEATLGHEA